MPYPEHDKLHEIVDKSQTVGEFIDWLFTQGVVLCSIDEDDRRYWPIHTSTTKLLAEFFDIDQDKIDAEKNEMLEALRTMHEERTW